MLGFGSARHNGSPAGETAPATLKAPPPKGPEPSSLVSRELQAIWLYAFRDWIRQSESFRDAVQDGRLRLPADLSEHVQHTAAFADLLTRMDRA